MQNMRGSAITLRSSLAAGLLHLWGFGSWAFVDSVVRIRGEGLFFLSCHSKGCRRFL